MQTGSAKTTAEAGFVRKVSNFNLHSKREREIESDKYGCFEKIPPSFETNSSFNFFCTDFSVLTYTVISTTYTM